MAMVIMKEHLLNYLDIRMNVQLLEVNHIPESLPPTNLFSHQSTDQFRDDKFT